MLTLNDGRSELWQWDTGRALTVDADCSQVHFSNKVFGRSIDVDVIDGAAIIPDVLLQTDKDLNVWAFVGTAENGYTKISKTFKVNRRNKPADYVFTPTEQTTIAEIAAIAQSVRDDADAGVFGGVQPDWNQNDSTAADYVKNRPFYTGDPVETVLVEESIVPFSDAGGLYQGQFLTTFEATVGKTYKVYWDGVAYESACVDYSGYIAIGNLSISGAGSDTGEPFAMLVNNGRGIAFYTADTSASHTFSISEFSQKIVKIDEKYLPKASEDSYGLIKTSDFVSVYNLPRNVPHDQMLDAIAAFKTGNANILWNGAKLSGAYYNSSDDTIAVEYASEPMKTVTYANVDGFYVKTLGSSTYRDELILKSSTEGSIKNFRITIDDSGTISAKELKN